MIYIPDLVLCFGEVGLETGSIEVLTVDESFVCCTDGMFLVVDAQVVFNSDVVFDEAVVESDSPGVVLRITCVVSVEVVISEVLGSVAVSPEVVASKAVGRVVIRTGSSVL